MHTVTTNTAIKMAAVLSAACASVLFSPVPSKARSECDEATKTFLDSRRVELLSTQIKGGRCFITYLKHRDGKRRIRVTESWTIGEFAPKAVESGTHTPEQSGIRQDAD